MQHGRNNLAEEKKLIKEIKASQQKAISSCLSLDELNRAVRSDMETLNYLRVNCLDL